MATMNTVRRTAHQTNLLTLALYRSFSRSTMGLRLAQESRSSSSERNWVNRSCVAMAMMGLGLSIFSTRQLYDDPNCKCLLWKK